MKIRSGRFEWASCPGETEGRGPKAYRRTNQCFEVKQRDQNESQRQDCLIVDAMHAKLSYRDVEIGSYCWNPVIDEFFSDRQRTIRTKC